MRCRQERMILSWCRWAIDWFCVEPEAEPYKKVCGFKSIRIRVDGAYTYLAGPQYGFSLP